MSDELQDLVREVRETQERLEKSIEKLSETPPTPPTPTQSVNSQSVEPTHKAILGENEYLELRKILRSTPDDHLTMMIASQMRKEGQGIPLNVWMSNVGNPGALSAGIAGLQNQVEPEVAKALDSTAVAPLIRQDLEPMLYEVFVRYFPAYDSFGKEPANGLVHAYNKVTSYGDAQFMPELGTVTDDASTFQRATTNIAILATRRGISLKSAFAVVAGGMPYNPEAIEMVSASRAIANKMQATIFGGQATDSGGTSANELGAYDANGFTGLRSILNAAGASVNVDPATNPTTTGNLRRAVDAAILPIVQAGGLGPLTIWSNPTEKITWDEQQDSNVRILEAAQVGAGVGVVANAVNTIAGPIPWRIVPGTSISSYTAATYSGNTVRDVYIVDPSTMSLPYLGAAGPTVLEIPVGVAGQLVRLFIVFMMNGLAVKVPTFSNKVRVKVA